MLRLHLVVPPIGPASRDGPSHLDGIVERHGGNLGIAVGVFHHDPLVGLAHPVERLELVAVPLEPHPELVPVVDVLDGVHHRTLSLGRARLELDSEVCSVIQYCWLLFLLLVYQIKHPPFNPVQLVGPRALLLQLQHFALHFASLEFSLLSLVILLLSTWLTSRLSSIHH